MVRRLSSEFRAYPWIESQLKERGWNTKNPNTSPAGEVWTQGECLTNDEIKRALGERKPEDVVRLASNAVWIIEAKGQKDELEKSLNEAKVYAKDINEISNGISAQFVSGVAGADDTGYILRTEFFNGKTWEDVRVDEQPLDRFPTKPELIRILHHGYADLAAVPMSLAEVVELAGFINKKLHAAKVEKDSRATMVAIAMLALEQDPDLAMRTNAQVFINDLNSRAETVFLESNRKSLWEIIKIRPSKENLSTQASALSEIVEKLKSSDILHSVKRTDVLGSFFESFLRYGNSSKDLGIVLTPRHLCWLATEAIAVAPTDFVYDPAAGTGGFLVAAFNRVHDLTHLSETKRFASNNIFASEVSPKVAALAFVNMHFRGDGKHNLKIDSCFQNRLSQSVASGQIEFKSGMEFKAGENRGITKVLMNPPFALEDNETEPAFVDHALHQMSDRGLLFSVLPASVLYESSFQAWRQQLLRTNTLLSAISFPIDVFYPVATETVGIFVRKGVPHRFDQPILWARIADDGYAKRKGFRVEKPAVSYKEVLQPYATALQLWHTAGQRTAGIPGFIEYSPIANNKEELLPQVKIGLAELEANDLERSSQVIYKNITGQVWDQELRSHADVD